MNNKDFETTLTCTIPSRFQSQVENQNVKEQQTPLADVERYHSLVLIASLSAFLPPKLSQHSQLSKSDIPS